MSNIGAFNRQIVALARGDPRLASTTTGSSTQRAPALPRSALSEGQDGNLPVISLLLKRVM
jgi:hypothetical protein